MSWCCGQGFALPLLRKRSPHGGLEAAFPNILSRVQQVRLARMELGTVEVRHGAELALSLLLTLELVLLLLLAIGGRWSADVLCGSGSA